MNQRAKRWTATLNNPTEEETLTFLALTQCIKNVGEGLAQEGNMELCGNTEDAMQMFASYLAEGADLQQCMEDVHPKIVKRDGSLILTYLVFGRELAPSTGTPHLQVYAEFCSPKSRKQVLEILNPRLALFKSKGNQKQNRTYCTKDGVFQEAGFLKAPGRRTDLLEVKEELENGANMRQIAMNHFGSWIRYRQAFSDFREMVQTRTFPHHPMESYPDAWRVDMPEKVTIFWGPSGVGKTSFAKT